MVLNEVNTFACIMLLLVLSCRTYCRPCFIWLLICLICRLTHMSSSYRSSRFGLSHWDPYAMHRGGCLELYYCNMVEWSWWDSSLIWRPTGFLQCFDTVGLVIWPVKIVPDITYNVFGGTLSLYTTSTGKMTASFVVSTSLFMQHFLWHCCCNLSMYNNSNISNNNDDNLSALSACFLYRLCTITCSYTKRRRTTSRL